jgi:2-iminobutanoate/2-iminopropanoate deaminase
MIGLDENRLLLSEDVARQTRRALENLRDCLQAAGATLDDVCSVTAFLEDADRDFAAYNAAYKEFFPTDPPARATVQAHIVGDPVVEIQAIAVID